MLDSRTKSAPFWVRTTDEKGKFRHCNVLNLLVYCIIRFFLLSIKVLHNDRFVCYCDLITSSDYGTLGNFPVVYEESYNCSNVGTLSKSKTINTMGCTKDPESFFIESKQILEVRSFVGEELKRLQWMEKSGLMNQVVFLNICKNYQISLL